MPQALASTSKEKMFLLRAANKVIAGDEVLGNNDVFIRRALDWFKRKGIEFTLGFNGRDRLWMVRTTDELSHEATIAEALAEAILKISEHEKQKNAHG